MSDIPINVKLGEHGLYYGTSPAMKGLLVTGKSVEQVMDRVPYAIAEMHAAAELSRLKEERSQLLEIIYGINDVWLRAWQRELGPDATLSNDEQTQLNALNTRARSFLKENGNG